MPREDIEEEKKHEEEKGPNITLDQLTLDTKVNMMLRNQANIMELLSAIKGD